jgi:lipid II:glycine glycyltransferase (peptidoglycan interpeptide bridge formation enzyme)
MTPHLLQSTTWETFQQALGTKTLRIPTGTTDCLGLIERSHGKIGKFFTRLYTPYGPTLASTKDLKKVLTAIESTAVSNGCDFVRIEPIGASLTEKGLVAQGYEKRKRSTQPTVTNIVSLEGSNEDVIARMNATNRNLWRKNVSLGDMGVLFRTVHTSDKAQPFLDMMHETSTRSGAVFHSDGYFRKMIDILGAKKCAGVMIASAEGDDVASTLYVIDHDMSTLYYLHAGSTIDARKYNAGNVLVSNLILHAKSLGLRHVDLFGVSPEDANESHPLYGISKFKRAYGGHDVAYIGTWEKSLTTKHRLTKRISTLIKRGS